MGDLLPGLIVLAIGGSIAPPLLLLTILFLGSRRPLPNASALALGYFTTCAATGVAGLTLFSEAAGGAASHVGRVISAALGALLLLVGLRSLLRAPVPGAGAPRWMESISSVSPAKAFGVGMALFLVQIKNLAIFVACATADNRGWPRSSRQRRSARACARGLRHPGYRAHRPLRDRAAAGLGGARVAANVDGEEQPRDHGRALSRVRSVLPRQRPPGSVRS